VIPLTTIGKGATGAILYQVSGSYLKGLLFDILVMFAGAYKMLPITSVINNLAADEYLIKYI
jgi:hypothetical protein